MTLVQARVDERTVVRLSAYATAKRAKRKKKMTDNELVHHALNLVVIQANRDLAALQRKRRADLDHAAHVLRGGSAIAPKDVAAVTLGPGVPSGTAKTFQAAIKDEELLDRLHAMSNLYGATDSELIRRGFKLILKEMADDQDELLQGLKDDYDATVAAIVDIDPEPIDTDTSAFGPASPVKPTGDSEPELAPVGAPHSPNTPDSADGPPPEPGDPDTAAPAPASLIKPTGDSEPELAPVGAPHSPTAPDSADSPPKLG